MAKDKYAMLEQLAVFASHPSMLHRCGSLGGFSDYDDETSLARTVKRTGALEALLRLLGVEPVHQHGVTNSTSGWHLEDLSTELEYSRMKIHLVTSLLLGLGLASETQAQSCRVGSGPDFGDGIPYCSELSSEELAPEQVPETPQWSSRWGAIAIDPKVAQGGVGVASDMESRASAEAAAMTMCHDNGGGETCRIEVSYDNQCAVIAWGDHYYVTANAETVGEASRIGLKGCGRRTENCRIVYSNCSYPVRLR